MYLGKRGHSSTCRECKAFPLFGTRFVCLTCPGHNLCQKCKDVCKHSHHEFDAIPEDDSVFMIGEDWYDGSDGVNGANCTYCKSYFEDIEVHINESHLNCNECSITFETGDEAFHHFEENHLCRYCKYEVDSFNQVEMKMNHERNHHQCNFCEKRFDYFQLHVDKLKHIKSAHKGISIFFLEALISFYT